MSLSCSSSMTSKASKSSSLTSILPCEREIREAELRGMCGHPVHFNLSIHLPHLASLLDILLESSCQILLKLDVLVLVVAVCLKTKQECEAHHPQLIVCQESPTNCFRRRLPEHRGTTARSRPLISKSPFGADEIQLQKNRERSPVTRWQQSTLQINVPAPQT